MCEFAIWACTYPLLRLRAPTNHANIRNKKTLCAIWNCTYNLFDCWYNGKLEGKGKQRVRIPCGPVQWGFWLLTAQNVQWGADSMMKSDNMPRWDVPWLPVTRSLGAWHGHRGRRCPGRLRGTKNCWSHNEWWEKPDESSTYVDRGDLLPESRSPFPAAHWSWEVVRTTQHCQPEWYSCGCHATAGARACSIGIQWKLQVASELRCEYLLLSWWTSANRPLIIPN